MQIIKKIPIISCISLVIALVCIPVSGAIGEDVIVENAEEFYAVAPIVEELGYDIYKDDCLNCYTFINEEGNTVVQEVGKSYWVDVSQTAHGFDTLCFIDQSTGELMVSKGMLKSAFGIDIEEDI